MCSVSGIPVSLAMPPPTALPTEAKLALLPFSVDAKMLSVPINIPPV
jgi:hypothetical protein